MKLFNLGECCYLRIKVPDSKLKGLMKLIQNLRERQNDYNET